MTKFDLNKDGLEDIINWRSCRRSYPYFYATKKWALSLKKIPAFEQDKAYKDAAIAVFDANGDGHPDIYIASGGYNNLTATDSLLQDRLYLNDGKNNFIKSNSLPDISGSKSCVKIQDINGDGSPDIFVGGRVVPGVIRKHQKVIF